METRQRIRLQHQRRACLLAVALAAAFGPAMQTHAADQIDPEAAAALEKYKTMSMDDLMSLEVPVVYGASKYNQRVTDAPASVSIVTADEIERFGHRTLGEALQSVRGLVVGYDRNYTYLGVRGFQRPGDYNSRVLVLIDGHRLNDNIFNNSPLGTDFPIDPDLIDRIEVIRGPSSSIYGSSAFLGVVNVVTKKARDLDGIEGSCSAGAFDSYRGRFTIGRQFSTGWDMVLSGSYYQSDGNKKLYFREFDHPGANNGIARDSDLDEARQIWTRWGYRGLTLSGGYVRREKQIPTASYETAFNDGREQTIDERAFVAAAFQHQFPSETELTARIAYDVSIYKGIYPYAREDGNGDESIVLNQDEADGHWITTETQVKHALWDRHTLTAGLEHRANLRQDQANFDKEPRFHYFRDNQTSWTLGLFGQADIALLTNLTASAGVRYDYYNLHGDTLNPRAALIYHPWEPTTFKLLYGQAFRAPNAYEYAYEDSGTAKASPDVQPETIRTYEAVLEQRISQNWRFLLSGYWFEVEDLISQITDPADGLLTYRNLDQAQGKGIEWEIAYKTQRGFSARLSHALQRTEDAETGKQLTHSPKHLLRLNAVAPLYRDKFFAGVELQYNSSVHTLTREKADDFWIVNATLFSQNIVQGLELSATLYNVFDQNYAYAGGTEHVQSLIPQNGREFRVKMTYRF